ncbi:MAG: Crp/Fnr family transcriptional regulator [Candidatus Wallbacteria bacterium]|nr:Crp/Fnr family transcriptional regulator [Candidatus Wallbacteria bacterium]
MTVEGYALLRRIPELLRVPEDEIVRVARVAKFRSLRRKEVLFVESNQPAGLYLVESGWLKTFRKSCAGREVLLDVLGPVEAVGPCCGPASNCTFGCSAQALTAARVLVVNGADWRAISADCPSACAALTDMLFRSRRRCVDLAVELALHDIDSRLASLLLKLAGYRGETDSSIRRVVQVLSQQDMASAIGTAREVVTRHVARLVDRGVLGRSGRRIVVNQPAVLQSIALGQQADVSAACPA